MSAPDLTESDVDAVARVLRSGRLALGPMAHEFERRLADYVGRRYAVAVNSGTAAVHLAVKGLRIGPGDEVLVPSFTFAATVNAVLYERATPVFVDIEPDTYNIAPDDLERKRTSRTRAVLVVDIFGHPADWGRILDFSSRYDLPIIDDACEALGSEYRGARVGGLGHAATFGFYPNKQITTGEGGMLVTDDESLARMSRSLRNQGRTEMGAWLEHESLGHNYRMSEMSAALGTSQLARIASLIEKRDRVARLYDERLRELEWVGLPSVRPDVRVSRFVYVAALARELDRDAVMGALEERGIPSRAYFPPLHLQPYVRRRLKGEAVRLPVTESVARRTLALPFHGGITETDVDRVVDALRDAVKDVHGIH